MRKSRVVHYVAICKKYRDISKLYIKQYLKNINIQKTNYMMRAIKFPVRFLYKCLIKYKLHSFRKILFR